MKKLIMLVMFSCVGIYCFGQDASKHTAKPPKYTRAQLDSVITHARTLFNGQQKSDDTIRSGMDDSILERPDSDEVNVLPLTDTAVVSAPKIKIKKWESPNKEIDAINAEMVSKLGGETKNASGRSISSVESNAEKEESARQNSSETKTSRQTAERPIKDGLIRRWSKN